MGRKLIFMIFVGVLMAGFVMVVNPAMAAEEKKPEQFVGILAYRTGPFAAGGSGFSSGMEDFMALVNMKGGINGKIMYKWEECETAYNTARGVECYNRFKDRMAKVHPLSTGITYAL
ncbi:MAG: ABC transporter substrate-binding protein, partial [Desulfobacteraceae bacterium]